ncbi:hypothetical protein SNE40_015090 [Patella caerulea]|uniref:Tyrosine specific protein phosphatases domain-containing protein n=1 Tax=Patella caerulea TaxID=87958 RepID=A0AAN8JH23_PATCE
MNESSDGDVSKEDIHLLLEHFSKSTHKVRSGDMKGDTVMETCLMLMGKDYKYSVVQNFSGELCGQYPHKLILLEYELREGDDANISNDLQSMYDMDKLREVMKQARFARCRSRFVVPVILYEGKHICRSATLSSGPEMYGRTGFDFLFSSGETIPNGANGGDQSEQLFDRYRGHDIRLLKELSVGYICDLMVEKKKVKFGMNITSSEKVDKENRYSDFTILSVPYPGCEFFKEWKDKCFTGEAIQYDWNQGFNDALLDIPSTPLLSQLPIDWKKYRDWDLVQLTQNYLKLLLHLVTNGDKGLLVHCISGWDRTPLFVSLLRLTLWADGIIHRSLKPAEILYLTLGYDWYLFGHNLSDRLSKGEEILSFCFTFLRYIGSEEFSVIKRRRRTSTKVLNPDVINERRQAMRANSESSIPIDAVLLETDVAHSLRGSNASISSVSSAEMGPVTFTVGQDDENLISLGDEIPKPININRCRATNSPLATCSSSHNSGSSDNSFHSHGNHFSTSSSSPMAVPALHRYSDATRACSPGYGSWQIISSCGSFRGLGSTDSPHVSSEKSSSSGHSHVSFSSCQEASEINNTSLRWQKLDAVRRIFQNAYSNTITVRSNGNESGALSSLVNQFAEKVGIKSGKNSIV